MIAMLMWILMMLLFYLSARSNRSKAVRCAMANVYIEPRPKGHPAGAHIDDYVVEDQADHVLATFRTQREAIDWATRNGHTPHIARVRRLNYKQKADNWRAV
jgi:hypothetical protein